MAPCSHVWHYKCIRPILNDHKNYPQFLCPNCRAITDLDAEVDDPLVRWEDDDDIVVQNAVDSRGTNGTNGNLESAPTHTSLETEDIQMTENQEQPGALASRALPNSNGDNALPMLATAPDAGDETTASPLLSRRNPPVNELRAMRLTSEDHQYLRPITPTEPLMGQADGHGTQSQTPTFDMLVREGPMTPTNTAGPFVFDGSAGRRSGAEEAAAA